jgi:hypothetical protein
VVEDQSSVVPMREPFLKADESLGYTPYCSLFFP